MPTSGAKVLAHRFLSAKEFTLEVVPRPAVAKPNSYVFGLNHRDAHGVMEVPRTFLQQIVFGRRKCGFPFSWIRERLKLTISLGDVDETYDIEPHVMVEALYNKIRTSPENKTLRNYWNVDSWPEELQKEVHGHLESKKPGDFLEERKKKGIECRYCDKALEQK
ncbi:hypothetical protein MMC17_003373 [Xylographa soralifera]|nr:hypothetical protein [Xylographa soralifera]